MENLVINPDFWRGRRVFLTGHTGFKGAWLSLWLAEMGAEVTGYALDPEPGPSIFNLCQVGDRVRDIRGDILDLDRLQTAMNEAKPEIVLHLAAQALVRKSYAEPVQTYAVNVMGTVHVLEACRTVPELRAVLCVTSDKCYENREWPWGYRENDPMGGSDPYSNSKGCSELVVSAYRKSFFPVSAIGDHGVAVASARAGNVIGGGDISADRLVPDLLRGFSAGEKPVIRNPAAIRPWQHVLEPINGYLMLAERLWQGDASAADGWNFGPEQGDHRPVSWIADALAVRWGNGAGWALDDQLAKPEAQLLMLDCAKARFQLGWKPVWSLETALDRIVEWTQAASKVEDVGSVSLSQIHNFLGLIGNGVRLPLTMQGVL